MKRLEAGVPVFIDTARRYAELVKVPLGELLSASTDAAPEPIRASSSSPPPLRRPDDATTSSYPPPTSPEAPAIAVLPFRLMRPDEDDEYFADGLAEDLTMRLGRRWFPVISRGSTFRYRQEVPEPQKLRTELGARYLIEGTVRRSADKLRVTAKLTDAASARQLWASTYDRPLGDVFNLQDDLVSTIVGRADNIILDEEYRGIVRREPQDLHAWELSLRGSWCFHRKTKEGNVEARGFFEEALRKDAKLPLAWYFLAFTHHRAVVQQWSADPAESARRMREVCDAFAAACPNDPWWHVAAGCSAFERGDVQTALVRLREAIELEPNAIVAHSLYGQALSMANRPEEAIASFAEAMRLSPRDAELWSIQTATALCHFVAERYDSMLTWAKRAVRTRPDMPFPHGTVAVAYWHLGEKVEAKRAADQMLALEPRTTVRGLEAIVRATEPSIAKRYMEGLQGAGIPA